MSFWTQWLPQLCYAEGIIRDAVLALSTLYEHPPADKFGAHRSVSQEQSQALKWYNRSIAQLHRPVNTFNRPQQRQLALLSCFLYSNIEIQQNNVANANNLLKSGQIMATAYFSEKRPTICSSQLDEMLHSMFLRQTVLLANFSHRPVPQYVAHIAQTNATETSQFHSLNEARSHLYALMWQSLEVVSIAAGKPPEPGDPPLEVQQTQTLDGLERWRAQLDQLTHELMVADQQLIQSTLLMYYQVALIWASVAPTYTETSYDLYVDRFKDIVERTSTFISTKTSKHADHDQRQPFSSEMGIIPPLFFTAWHCRHPVVRRKALALMRHAPAQEGLFIAEITIKTIEKVIELEEGPHRLPLDHGVDAERDTDNEEYEMPSEDYRIRMLSIYYESMDGVKTSPVLLFSQPISDRVASETENLHASQIVPL